MPGFGETMVAESTRREIIPRGWCLAFWVCFGLTGLSAIATASGVAPGSREVSESLVVEAGAMSTGRMAAIAVVSAPSQDSRSLAPASRDRVFFDATRLPGRLKQDRLRPQWARGIEFERHERFLASAQQYEQIVSEVPEEEYTYWRISRNYWRYAEALPTESVEQRLVYFQRAADWADRGMAVDPDCGACMLWKFVSLGRQATTRGLLSAVSDAREMNRLLSRGIELQPLHRDNAGNSTLGNLYYAASVFYRIVPDWWWLRVFVGVRGDKAKSVRYARRAVEASPVRVDYRIELGASLICLGTVEDEHEPIAEGEQVLRAALLLPDYLSTDSVDRQHAKVLLGAPGKACGYSRDGFIDVDALEERARNGEADTSLSG